MSFYRFAQGVVRIVARMKYKLRLEGLDNVPSDRGFLLCSNHVSNFDPILVGRLDPAGMHLHGKGGTVPL